MKRRWLAAVVVCACLAMAAGLAAYLLTWESRIDPDHFRVIEVGMSRAEVERVLGGPPRNECSGPVDFWVRHEGGQRSAGIERGSPAVQFFPDADAVVFGHSHLPLHEERDGFQIFNPGSPTERRRAPNRSMGEATIAGGSIELRHVTLP